MNELSPSPARPWSAELPSDTLETFERGSSARLITGCCISMVIAVILTSRLGLPLGAKQVPLVLPVAVAHLVVIALLGRATLSLARTLATVAVVAIVLFESALVHHHTSPLSLMYVVAIYGPLVINSTLSTESIARIWKVFIGLAAVTAVLGIAQIAIQIVAGGYYLDPLQLLPEKVRLLGYQTTYPIMRGVIPTLKANGMVFVEASAFSQFLALAILGELWLFRRWKVVTLLAAGMTLSFSGTGLLMLAGGLAIGAKPRATLALAGAVLVVGVILLATGYGEAFTSRIDEVRRPGTSGYERFVSPFVAMTLPWHDSTDAVVWGYGAGRVEDLDTEYAANYSPVPKVILEYGLAGFCAFCALWIAMFRGLAVQRPIAAALGIMYFLAAGSLLQPYTVFSLWALTAGFAKKEEPADTLAGESA